MRVAGQLLENHDYFGAAKTLGDLPKGLRGPDGNELLEEAVTKAAHPHATRKELRRL
ncbi:MAG: hypothetical protein R3B96_04675 [Pirellulaceae bacterium]